MMHSETAAFASVPPSDELNSFIYMQA